MRSAWVGLIFGVLAVATMPVAIITTRWSNAYDLVHAAFAIPVAVGLAVVALSLASAGRRASGMTLETAPRGVARAGRLLGALGLCLAASGLVSVAVFGILTYLSETA